MERRTGPQPPALSGNHPPRLGKVKRQPGRLKVRYKPPPRGLLLEVFTNYSLSPWQRGAGYDH